jgi:hypothetical protein
MEKLRLALGALILALLSCSLFPGFEPETVRETVIVEVTREVTQEVTREVVITATPPPTFTAKSPSAMILEEEFSGGRSGWYTGEWEDSSIVVEAGQLVLRVNVPNLLITSGHPILDYVDRGFDFTFDILHLDETSDSYAGVDFRYWDADNYAEFLVDGAGFMTFGVMLEGEYFDIIPWIRSQHVNRDQNTIRLLDYGERVVVYANEEMLFDLPFDDLSPAGVLLVAGSFDEGIAAWAFDNLVVREVE